MEESIRDRMAKKPLVSGVYDRPARAVCAWFAFICIVKGVHNIPVGFARNPRPVNVNRY